MAIQECRLTLDRSARELQPHGTVEFPCGGYTSFHTNREKDGIPWHWHEEIEVIYIKEGGLELKVPSACFHLKAGDCAAVNSNVLHSLSASGAGRLYSLVFAPRLVAGNGNSVFAEKYIQPLISCSSFLAYQMPDSWKEQAAGWFLKAFDALSREKLGFEFEVRENLSRICLLLYQQFQDAIGGRQVRENLDSQRVRRMLEYIQNNFSRDILLSEIAEAADIGERECLRCFQKTIQLSPIQYLIKYRVMQGADLLLEQPDSTVSQIAALCGFDSPSNFSRTFKRFYQRTPREYRKEQYGRIEANTL